MRVMVRVRLDRKERKGEDESTGQGEVDREEGGEARGGGGLI